MQHLLRLLLIPSVALLAAWPALAAGELHRAPYLQQASPDGVVVVWRTLGAITPVLRYGDAPDALAHTVAGEAITLRVAADVNAPEDVPRLYQEPAEDAAKRRPDDHDPSTAPNTHQYEAPVRGLEPNTKQYYAVYDGERLLAGGDADHYFVTHPPVGSAADMRIWVVGDSGTGGTDQALVHDAMRGFIAETKRPLDHYIHVGDMAYGDGTDWEFHHHFFAPYQATLRNTVCWPTMGNHEGNTSRGITGEGPYYDAYVVPTAGEVGGAPSGTEAYYSFDIADVHFICLDSHDLDRKPDGAMAQWLRADLEQAKAKWMIAFWHHPPYSKGSHDSDIEGPLIEMREHIMPILESAGVDVTLTGHSHIYERSMLMDGAYATPTVAEGVILDDGDGNPEGDGAYRKSAGLNPNEGAVNVVAGHGGASLGRRGTMPVMREIILEHGSVILDIQGDTLTGIMLDKFGARQDLFSIVKQGQVTPVRVENPWQPVHDLSLITRLAFNFREDRIGATPQYWSVAQGSAGGLRVAGEADGKQRHLRAEAGAEDLIGLFDAATVPRYRFQTMLRFTSETGAKAGLVFGYVDAANHWRAVVDAAAGAIRVSRVADGVETALVEKAVAVEREKWLPLEVAGEGTRARLEFGSDLKVEFDPGAALPDAYLGCYVPAGAAAEYLAFQIRR